MTKDVIHSGEFDVCELETDEFDFDDEFDLDEFDEEEFNLAEFKELLNTLNAQVQEMINEDEDNQEVVSSLIESMSTLQKELNGVNNEEEFFENHFRRLLPDIQQVMQFLAIFNDRMDDEDEGDDFLSDSQEIHEEWMEEFVESPAFQKLSENEQSQCRFHVAVFCDILEFHGMGDPELWAEEDLEQVCLVDLPQRFVAKAEQYSEIASHLIEFFNFLSENQYLEQADELKKYIQSISKEMVKRAGDSSQWSPEKKFGMDAIEKDPTLENDSERLMYLLEQHFSENEEE